MAAVQDVTGGAKSVTGWRRSLAEYTDRRVMLILPLGFASGLPLLLTFSTLSAWFASVGVSRATIGAFALVGTPYAFKFLWSPLIQSPATADSNRAPARMGSRDSARR